MNVVCMNEWNIIMNCMQIIIYESKHINVLFCDCLISCRFHGKLKKIYIYGFTFTLCFYWFILLCHIRIYGKGLQKLNFCKQVEQLTMLFLNSILFLSYKHYCKAQAYQIGIISKNFLYSVRILNTMFSKDARKRTA